MAARAAGRDFSKETEYFGHSPTEYLDNIMNAVFDYTADVLDAVEGVLKEQEGLKGRDKDVEKALNNILSLYKGNIDENFDKFELYVLNNILRIPDNVALPAKEVPRPAAREEAKVNADIEELRRKIAATQYVTDSIKMQSDLLDKQIGELRPFTEKIVSLANMSSSQRLEPHRAMQRAIEHAKELHALMHQVELQTAKEGTEVGRTPERFSEEQFNQLQSFLGSKR